MLTLLLIVVVIGILLGVPQTRRFILGFLGLFGAVGVVLGYLLLVLGPTIAVIWIGVHFARKYW